MSHKQSQRLRILAALKKARSRGLTSLELSKFALCYTRRITELRTEFHIESLRMSHGGWKYILHPGSWA